MHQVGVCALQHTARFCDERWNTTEKTNLANLQCIHREVGFQPQQSPQPPVKPAHRELLNSAYCPDKRIVVLKKQGRRPLAMPVLSGGLPEACSSVLNVPPFYPASLPTPRPSLAPSSFKLTTRISISSSLSASCGEMFSIQKKLFSICLVKGYNDYKVDLHNSLLYKQNGAKNRKPGINGNSSPLSRRSLFFSDRFSEFVSPLDLKDHGKKWLCYGNKIRDNN